MSPNGFSKKPHTLHLKIQVIQQDNIPYDLKCQIHPYAPYNWFQSSGFSTQPQTALQCSWLGCLCYRGIPHDIQSVRQREQAVVTLVVLPKTKICFDGDMTIHFILVTKVIFVLLYNFLVWYNLYLDYVVCIAV